MNFVVKYIPFAVEDAANDLERGSLTPPYTLEEIAEIKQRGLSLKRYRSLREAGVTHEVILEVNGWFDEYHLPLAVRNSLLGTLQLIHEMKLDYHALRSMLSFNPEHLKRIGSVLRGTGKLSDCYTVLELEISPPAYLRRYRRVKQ